MENQLTIEMRSLLEKSLELVKTIGRKFKFSYVP